jgi:hypothetical protein
MYEILRLCVDGVLSYSSVTALVQFESSCCVSQEMSRSELRGVV